MEEEEFKDMEHLHYGSRGHIDGQFPLFVSLVFLLTPSHTSNRMQGNLCMLSSPTTLEEESYRTSLSDSIASENIKLYSFK